MAWVKLDDQARHHRKLLSIGPTAAWLWVCGLMYCNSQKARDGLIPHEAVAVLYPISTWRKEVRRLLDAGLWEEVSAGYVVHDYHDYQPTAEKALETSETKAAAGRLGGVRSGQARRSKNEAADEANSKHPASSFEAYAKHGASLLPKPVPIPSRPVHSEDPPVVPQGGTQVLVDPQREQPWRVPKSEVRLARDEWIQAYTASVVAESGDSGWSFRPQTFGTLERVVSARCPTGARVNIAAWLESVVAAFVRATRDQAQLWSGFSPDGHERWWNAGRPGLTEAPKRMPPLPPEPEGEPLSAEEQAQMDELFAKHPRPKDRVAS
jgi:hypothetical protein